MDQTGAVTPDQPSETPKEDAVAQEPSSATPAPPAQSNGEADPASPTAPTATDPDTIKDTPPATASDQAEEPHGAPSGESDAALDPTADADEVPATPAAPAGSDAKDEAPAIAAAPLVTPAPALSPEADTGEADVSDIGDGDGADADSSLEEMAVPPAVPPSPADELAPPTEAAPPAGAEAEEIEPQAQPVTEDDASPAEAPRAEEMVEGTGEETGASPQTAPDESEAAQATMDTPANAGSQAAADTPAAADRHEPGETNSRSALPPETAPQDAQNANAEAPLP